MWGLVKDKYDNNFYLLNRDETVIRIHPQLKLEKVMDIVSKLDEISLPIEYTNGIKEIYFTFLKNGLHGDYCWETRTIRISCSKSHIDEAHSTLIHELGHHIDNTFFDEHPRKFINEWKKKSIFLKSEHPDLKKDSCEYFAIGFEKYHLDQLNKTKFPELVKLIKESIKKACE